MSPQVGQNNSSIGCQQYALDLHALDTSNHQWETLIFLIGAITVGTVVLHLTSVPALENLQFTVVLFVLGVCFALLAESGMLVGIFIRSYKAWVAVDPHLLLFTFLPALLCGDAMTIDTHVARKVSWQCVLLAGPGVLIGSFSTALVVWKVLPYGWDFSTSLVVGSILAATDPVAVVGLLKGLGASPALTLLIQGESLLNDGTAVVLFMIAYEIAGGKTYGVGEIASKLLKSTIGASILGAVVGIFFFLWIRKACDRLFHCSSMVQISLTICCGYWSFILAEGVFHISGVLSTVASALVLADKMWPVLVERQAMLEIWHFFEILGNTIVFFLAGALVGKSLAAINFSDLLWAIVMYIFCVLIRLFMLVCMLPLLSLTGQRLTVKDILVMTWGGLRGMVGLALAILVKQDAAGGKLSELDGDRVLFLVGSVAALTLIVNAPTSPALTRVLGISQATEGRRVLMANVARRAETHVEHLYQELILSKDPSKHVFEPGIVQELIRRLCAEVKNSLPEGQRKSVRLAGSMVSTTSSWVTASWRTASFRQSAASRPGLPNLVSTAVQKMLERNVTPPDVEKLWDNFESAKLDILRKGTNANIVKFQFGKQLDVIRKILAHNQVDQQQLKTVREVFLECLRANYWEQLQKGRFNLGSVEPAILLHSVDSAKESVASHLADWEVLVQDLKLSSTERSDQTDELKENSSRSLCKGNSSPSCTKTFSEDCAPHSQNGLRRRFRAYRVKRNYERQASALQVISAFQVAHLQSQMQIASFFGKYEDVDSPEEAYVIIESHTEVFLSSAMMSTISREVQQKVSTMWEAHRLADHYHNFVLSVHDSGVLQAREAEELLHPFAHFMRQLDQQRRHITKMLKSRNQTGKSTNSNINAIDAALCIQRCVRKWKDRNAIERTMQGGSRVKLLAPTMPLPGALALHEEEPEPARPEEPGFQSVIPQCPKELPHSAWVGMPGTPEPSTDCDTSLDYSLL